MNSTVPANKPNFLLNQQQPKPAQTLDRTSTVSTKAPHQNPQHQHQMDNANRVEATNTLAILPPQSKV